MTDISLPIWTHNRTCRFLSLPALREAERTVLSDLNLTCENDAIPGAYPADLKCELRQYQYLDDARVIRLQWELQYHFNIKHAAGVKPLRELPPFGRTVFRRLGDPYP